MMVHPKKTKRGLASASPETRARVARLGGIAVQKSGRGHKLTNEERSKGGKNSSGGFRGMSPEEVRKYGSIGGKRSRRTKAQ